MGDLYWVGSGPINLGAATALTTLALQTPSAPRIKLSKIVIHFNGTTAANTPVYATIQKITNTPSGTAIPTNYGPNAVDWAGPSPLTVAKCPSTATPGVWTTAPTLSTVFWDMGIPPTSGYPEWVPLGFEIDPSVSSWFGVTLTAAQAVTAYTSLLFSE